MKLKHSGAVMNNHVLIVAEHDLTSKGGIQRNMASVTQHLSGKFVFDVVVFTEMTESEKKQFPNYRNIYCIPCDSNNSKLYKIYENLTRPFRIYINGQKIIGKGKYQAIHCHDTQKAPILMWIAKKRGVPVRIMHCHNPATREPEHGIRKRYFEKVASLVNPCSNVKFGCSRDTCNSIFGKEANKAFVVNNEIDLSYFDPKKYLVRGGRGYSFIHVGRFTYQKNHEFLLKVFGEIHKAIPESRLTLIGWGELEKQILQERKNLNLEDAIDVLPGDSDIPRCMSQSDYMIFPSRYEGLGRVLIEAQSMNIMCFASDCIPKETELGLCDYLSLEDGYEKWATYIIDFLRGNKRELRHLNKSKQAAFDVDVIIDTYAEIYRGEHCE